MKTLQSNFTTPEQSKRLLELGVPADSADCYYQYLKRYNEFAGPIVFAGNDNFTINQNSFPNDEIIPCWSVGRLMEIYSLCINCMPGMDLRLYGNDYVEEIIAAFELASDDGLNDFSKLEE